MIYVHARHPPQRHKHIQLIFLLYDQVFLFFLLESDPVVIREMVKVGELRGISVIDIFIMISDLQTEKKTLTLTIFLSGMIMIISRIWLLLNYSESRDLD